MHNQEQWQARWYSENYFREETLVDVIRRSAVARPETYIALESDVLLAQISATELLEEAELLASAMYGLGIHAGDVVAIQLPNCIEAVALCEAVILLGAVILPITAIFGESELGYILENSRAKLLVMPSVWRQRDYRTSIERLRGNRILEHIVLRDGVVPDDHAPNGALSWSNFRAMAQRDFPLSSAKADELAVLIYTSGTTSNPKGVMHTHNSLLSEARAMTLCLAEQTHATFLNPWPFGHIAGLIPFLHFWLNSANVVLTDRWEPLMVARIIERHRVGATSGVPYFLDSLMQAADGANINISSLKIYATGATNVPPTLVQKCNERGIVCYRQYGSTEHPTVTTGVPGDPVEKLINTDGRCVGGNRIRILDDNGREVAAGIDGEIATAGPERCIGYNDSARNAEFFTADGWFLTGDVGHLDADGYLTITDRKKDIIIRGGENISSREVEECMLKHPAVIEVAAVAMPDQRLGEKVCVFVVKKAEMALDIAGVSEHFARHGLARQKTPEYLMEISALPRTATGKVLKAELRKRLRGAVTVSA